MNETERNIDCIALEQDLASADYIAAERVAEHHLYDDPPNAYDDHDPDYAAITREKDTYGNVLSAVLYVPESDSRVIAVATRRDDCYNEDGTRPAWSIHAAGEFSLDSLDAQYDDDELNDWFEHEPDTVERTVCNEILRKSAAWRLEAISSDHITFEDRVDFGRIDVEYTLE